VRSRAEAIESGGEAAGDRIKDDHDRWQATHRQGLRAKATSGTQHGTDAGLRAVLENNDCKVEQVQLYRLPAQDRRVVSNGETAQALGQGAAVVLRRRAHGSGGSWNLGLQCSAGLPTGSAGQGSNAEIDA